jgi:hypothetical protein
MSGELIAQLGCGDLLSEKSMGYDQSLSAVLGYGMKIRGLSFPKVSTKVSAASYTGIYFIPNALTLAAHTTFVIHVTDDGTNSADLGKVVYFGVTTKPLASTAIDLDMDTTATAQTAYLGTEQTGSGTLSTSTGGVLAISITVSTGTGTMGSGAASGIAYGLRVRRMGEAAADTCTGRVIVPLVHVNNT